MSGTTGFSTLDEKNVKVAMNLRKNTFYVLAADDSKFFSIVKHFLSKCLHKCKKMEIRFPFLPKKIGEDAILRCLRQGLADRLISRVP